MFNVTFPKPDFIVFRQLRRCVYVINANRDYAETVGINVGDIFGVISPTAITVCLRSSGTRTNLLVMAAGDTKRGGGARFLGIASRCLECP